MELADIYQELFDDVSKRVEELEQGYMRRMGSKWPEAPLYRSDGQLEEIKEKKVRRHDPELASALDGYSEDLEALNTMYLSIVGDAIGDGPEGVAAETIKKHVDSSRIKENSVGSLYFVPPSADDSEVVSTKISFDRWIADAASAIAESDEKTFLSNLYADADEGLRKVYDEISDHPRPFNRVFLNTRQNLYDEMSEEDSSLPRCQDDWVMELWSLVNDPEAVEIDGEYQSIKQTIEEREEYKADVLEQAEYLEEELEYNIQEQLDEYKPSFGESIRRGLRRAFS